MFTTAFPELPSIPLSVSDVIINTEHSITSQSLGSTMEQRQCLNEESEIDQDFSSYNKNISPNVTSTESSEITNTASYPSAVSTKNRVLKPKITYSFLTNSIQTLQPCGDNIERQRQQLRSVNDGTVFPGKIDQNIIQELEKEIIEICSTLKISSDPQNWSAECCRKWLHWHMGKIYASQLYQGDFCMTGLDLCRLSLNEFRYFFPPFGETLHAQLDVWKQAKELSFVTNQLEINSARSTNPAVSQTNTKESARRVFKGGKCRCTDSTYSDNSQPFENFTNELVLDGNSDGGGKRPNERNSSRQTIHLWEFLKELLMQPSMYSNCIRWVNQEKGIFKIENSTRVAKLWGRRKNRPAMNYDKLSRSIRQYYKKNIIKKTEHSKRLVYQFCHCVL